MKCKYYKYCKHAFRKSKYCFKWRGGGSSGLSCGILRFLERIADYVRVKSFMKDLIKGKIDLSFNGEIC